MEHWSELRTAYVVARTGTVSAAADELGVHRATVVRHVDLLEESLGATLFHRHRRGYLLTEAGKDLLATAQVIDEQLEQLAGRARGRRTELAGELTITAMSVFIPVVLDVVEACRVEHPGLRLRVEVGERVLHLDRGEAHVALRLGRRPDHPDEVAQSLPALRSGLFAHPTYVERHGQPELPGPLGDHAFVHDRDSRVSAAWLDELGAQDHIAVSCPDATTAFEAMQRGIGMGFCPAFIARRRGLVEIPVGLDRVAPPAWVVTHRAMHRSARVRWVSARLRAIVGPELE